MSGSRVHACLPTVARAWSREGSRRTLGHHALHALTSYLTLHPHRDRHPPTSPQCCRHRAWIVSPSPPLPSLTSPPPTRRRRTPFFPQHASTSTPWVRVNEPRRSLALDHGLQSLPHCNISPSNPPRHSILPTASSPSCRSCPLGRQSWLVRPPSHTVNNNCNKSSAPFTTTKSAFAFGPNSENKGASLFPVGRRVFFDRALGWKRGAN